MSSLMNSLAESSKYFRYEKREGGVAYGDWENMKAGVFSCFSKVSPAGSAFYKP